MDRSSGSDAICKFADDCSYYRGRLGPTKIHQHSKKVYWIDQGDRCLDDDDGRNCANILLDSTRTYRKLDVISDNLRANLTSI